MRKRYYATLLGLIIGLPACPAKTQDHERVSDRQATDENAETKRDAGTDASPPVFEAPVPAFLAEYASQTCETGEDCLAKGRGQFEFGVVNEDQELAFTYFRSGCELDHPASCRELYFMLKVVNLGLGSKDVWAYGAQLLAKACHGGDGLACDIWAQRTTGTDKTDATARAKKSLRTACDTGSQRECIALAGYVEAEEAARLLRRACDELGKDATGGNAIAAGSACEAFAQRARDGDGTPKDADLFEEYVKKSCEIDTNRCRRQTGAKHSAG